MLTINNCPLCGKSDCIGVVKFTIDGNLYTAYKCTTSNSIIYSEKNDIETKLAEFKKGFDKLTNFQSKAQ